MAHLALPNSELHVGVSFDEHPRVQQLSEDPNAAVLFPGPDSRELTTLEKPPSTLVVIDGTWVQARKVLERNEKLLALPRVCFTPERPGNYRIRAEPAAHCVSTIEAVVEALGHLEKAPERFRPMLKAFEHMVDRQVEFAEQVGGARHRRKRARQKRPKPPSALQQGGELVAVYAEANAHALDSGVEGPAELVHLVALRLSSGERFEAIIAPRRQLAPNAPRHLELPARTLLEGESVEAALERWRKFVREGDRLCTWGPYAFDLLVTEGAVSGQFIDVRLEAARHFRRRPGGVEQAAVLFERRGQPSLGAGRAGRRLSALAQVIDALAALP